jgi:hypothetical protein
MDPVDKNAFPNPAPGKNGSLWLLLLCSLATIVVALSVSAGLFARQSPSWLVIGAGLAVFPLLPLVWHGLAEAGNRNRAYFFTGKSRLALRTLTVALIVLGVSLGNLGTHQVAQNLRDLARRSRSKPAAKPTFPPLPVPAAAKPHGLEPFIPADATLVLGLADLAAVEPFLAVYGLDARDKLDALATCKIDFTHVRILVAARGQGTHMFVVRAPGISDERNLYCLAGVMGPGRLLIRSEGSSDSKALHVSGLLSRTITFRFHDQETVIATDEAWQETASQKLFVADGATVQGRLGPPLLRVDRTAPLWLAGVDETLQGTWDLALDCRQDGGLLKLQGSATPPSGEGERAEISLRVPLAFAHALPKQAVANGIRGMVAFLAAHGAPQAPVKVPPPVAPAGTTAR